MTEKEFIEEIKKIGITPTKDQLQKLEKFYQLLIEWNQKINLTRIIEKEEVYLKHFYDSLTIAKEINLSKVNTLCDVGTGAGFPGIVLKIFYPDLELTLLDSNHKKIAFLEVVIKELNLKNVTCINSRAENLPKTYREYFDIVTSRAVAHLRILLELSIPYLKVGGKLIAMKGLSEEEIKESAKILEKLDSTIVDTIKFNLPIEGSNRSLVIVQKNKKTNEIYPRSYDKIVKNR